MKIRIERLEALIKRIDARATAMLNRAVADRKADGFLAYRCGLVILSERAKVLAGALDGLNAMANRRVA